MYALETVSRVGAIVELTFLFPASGIHTLLPDFWCKKMIFLLSFLLSSFFGQEDKCVLCSSMSTKMEVPLQSEFTECLVDSRHCAWVQTWLGICVGALGSPSLAGETRQLQIVFDMWYVQFSSVAQSCPTLCNPMDYSMPGFPVLHQLLELAQIHVHQVSDAIQSSHPLSSSSPPAFNLSQ